MFSRILQSKRHRAIRRVAKLSTDTASSRIKVVLIQLCGVLMLHSLLIVWFEGYSFRESIWLTFTTVTTVGYGDLSAATPFGQASTIIFLYLMGIWMLAQLASEYLDYRIERKQRIIKGLWSWKNMKDHIVIINAPERNTAVYLHRLVSQFRATPLLADRPIVLVTTHFPDGLPRSLTDQGVVYKHVNPCRGGFFDDVGIGQASYLVFLAENEGDSRSDSVTLDLLDQFKRTKDNCLVVAEAVRDSNYKRFLDLGADSVLRPVRAYPELIARALTAPGTERVLEDLFGYFGASIHRYDVEVDNMEWQSLVCKMVTNGLGIALGYIDKAGVVETCPPETAVIQARALLVMARDIAVPTQDALERCLATA